MGNSLNQPVGVHLVHGRFLWMESWARKQCRSAATRQVIAWFLATLGVAACFILPSRYWWNYFRGPFPLASSEFAAFDLDNSQKQFVAVTGTKVVPSGLQEVTTETRNGVAEKSYVSSEYFLLLMDDRLLVVQSKGQPEFHIDGELKPLPSGLAARMFPDPSDSDLRARLAPVMLSTLDSYRLPGYIAFGGLLAYMFLLWRFTWRSWLYVQDISRHPVVKRIESWTNSVDAVMRAERELETAVRFKRSGVVVTDNFVVYLSLFSFNLFPLHDLVWAYERVTTTYYYFVIPVSRSRQAVLTLHGGSVMVQASKAKVQELLTFLVNSVPWAVFGFTDELARAFKADPNGFAQVVEERRAQATAVARP